VKKAIRLLFCLLLSVGALSAHAREFNQAELDAVLAPIALYPDPLLTNILNASLFPQDVAAAAAWSRANPQLQGDAALGIVEQTAWHPSVKALVAYPDVLARMVESPQWLADLGAAYSGAPDAVNAEIQGLRGRAQANGNLQSNEQQYVYQQGQEIYVQPVYPNVVYAPYYNPYIVYGAWFWPAYRPVYWRPWVARPVYVTRVVAPVRIVQPVRVTPYHRIPESRRQPIIHSGPAFREPERTQWRQQPQRSQISAPPAQVVHRAPSGYNAPALRSMPAPQARASERPTQMAPRADVSRSNLGGRAFGQIRSGAGSSGNGGGRHRS